MTEQEKDRARRAVRQAIARGQLVRPLYCERCLASPAPARGGRPSIHGHHPDHKKPLVVEWLCAKCHRKETPLPSMIGAPCFGAANGMVKHPDRRPSRARHGSAKLSEQAVAKIKERTMKAREYAERFGVSRWTILDIWQGRTWLNAASPYAQEPAP